MKKILKSPMFWGASVFLVVMFLTLTQTNIAQRPYGVNPDA